MRGDRGYIVIRRKEGEKDLRTHFPANASVADMVRWCEKAGYKVLEHQIIPMLEDPRHLARIIITVKRA